MRCEVVYSAGVWEGRGEGDIWKEERKLLVWSTDENSLKITTKRSIKGLCMSEEGGTEEGVLQQEYQDHFAPIQTLGVG